MMSTVLTRGDVFMGASDTSQSDDELLTTDEALAVLGFSRNTLERRMKAGKIRPVNRRPSIERPKVLLFRRADVERLARGETTPDTGASDN